MQVLSVLYDGILVDVFSLPMIAKVHQALHLDPGLCQPIFLRWFDQLSRHMLIRFGLNDLSSSSPLQRWISLYFFDHLNLNIIGRYSKMEHLKASYPDNNSTLESEYQPRETISLPPLSESPMVERMFNYCQSNRCLVHVIVLARHCASSERASLTVLEHQSLGQTSALGAGLRFELLDVVACHGLYIQKVLSQSHALEQLSLEHLETHQDWIWPLIQVRMEEEEEENKPPSHNLVHLDLNLPIEERLGRHEVQTLAHLLMLYPTLNQPQEFAEIRIQVLIKRWMEALDLDDSRATKGEYL